MPVNSMYPAFIVMYYVVNDFVHEHKMPVVYVPGSYSPGTPPDEVRVIAKSGQVPFDTFALAYATVFAALLHNAANISFMELWEMDDIDADPRFVTAKQLALLGTGGVGVVPMSQAVFSFRTEQGGVLMPRIMEGVTPINVRDEAPLTGTARVAYADYLLGNTSPIVGRDGGYPAAIIRMTSKTNDALRKRRLISS